MVSNKKLKIKFMLINREYRLINVDLWSLSQNRKTISIVKKVTRMLVEGQQKCKKDVNKGS